MNTFHGEHEVAMFTFLFFLLVDDGSCSDGGGGNFCYNLLYDVCNGSQQSAGARTVYCY